MSEIFLENQELQDRFITEKDFKLTEIDLQYIWCDGKQCDPVTCLKSSCKVFEYYWRKK